MTDICQFFRVFCPRCSHLLALKCQLWDRSLFYSWSARCQADCKADACQSERESPRGSWRGYSYLFLVLPTSLYCAQDCTQHIWPCILLRPHCCVFQCIRSVRACCIRWWYVPQFLNVVCTTCILDLAPCGRSLPWCWGPALELPWSEPRCLLWCCFYWALDMCGSCLRLLTHFCARCHAETFHIRLQFHLALFRWLYWSRSS